jgi:glutamate-1-semialdehyde 2,1-aminomutase
VDVGPVFIESACGSKLTDVDGNEYLDYVGSWGPMILGHAHEAVVRAVHRAVGKGTSFGAPTVAETELAERLIGAFASIERLRMVSSGTEAVMTAIRLARAHTGRELIVKMAGCYHGHSDSLLVAAGSGLAERGTASSPGVCDALVSRTVVVPYNDPDAVVAVFDRYHGKIAAVLVEPVAANMGVIPPAAGYLHTLRRLCDEHRTVLIFDEVISGFRVAWGGAQERYGVQADLTCLGKIIGGGLPLAAFGGRAEIMDRLAPSGQVYQAGTLSGNPIATVAALATLEILAGPDSYLRLETAGAALERGLADAAADASVAVTINRVGSLLSCFFTDQPVRDFADVQATDIVAFKTFFSAMLDRHVYLAPSAYEAMFVSLAHTDQDIERTIEAARESFVEVAGK